MGDFAVLNEEQKALIRSIGIEPEGYVVILENDRSLCLRHLRSRHDVMISKNEVVKNGSK